MDEDGLPLMGSGIDLTKVPATQQNRTVAFLSKFAMHTVHFLNRFSSLWGKTSSPFSSYPADWNDSQYSSCKVIIYSRPRWCHIGSISCECHEDHKWNTFWSHLRTITAEQFTGLWTTRYLKMLQVGDPVMAIRDKMISEWLDPDFLERPDAPVPDGEGEKNTEESSDSESSFSD